MLKAKNKKTEKEIPPIFTKNLLCIALSFLLFNFTHLPLQAQTIPKYFFGQNAWMPDTIGIPTNYKYLNGQLHKNWENVRQSNVKLMRFAGKTADKKRPSDYQYLKMVDSIRNKGMEPILQVPFGDFAYDSSEARKIVTYINVTKNKQVKFWSILNEPDKYDINKSAAKISKYIKEYAIAMKKVDPTILIIGPEMSRMSGDAGENLYKVVDTLTTWADTVNSIVGLIPAGNGVATGKGYIDYFSYHAYNYDASGTNTKTRAWLISRLTDAEKDSARMGWLKRRLDECNTNRSSQPIKPVMTEANICYYDTNTVYNDNWEGVKGNSFLAGQQLVEFEALGINKALEWINWWSVMEGSGLGSMTNDYINPTKKSTYYHLQAMGQWYKGTSYLGKDSSTSLHANIKNIKAFGAKDTNQIAVFIMNQDSLGSTPTTRYYSIRLNGSYPSTDTNRITLSMGIDKTYHDTIQAASTTLLLFDANGNITKKYWYRQSDGSSQPGFYQPYCSDSVTYTTATPLQLDKYIPGAYSSITIDGSSLITLDASDNKIYKAVNSITITKNFSSGSVGQTLSLITDPTCQ